MRSRLGLLVASGLCRAILMAKAHFRVVCADPFKPSGTPSSQVFCPLTGQKNIRKSKKMAKPMQADPCRSVGPGGPDRPQRQPLGIVA